MAWRDAEAARYPEAKALGRTWAYKFILMIVSPHGALYPCYQGPKTPQALFHLIPTVDSQGGHYSFKMGKLRLTQLQPLS